MKSAAWHDVERAFPWPKAMPSAPPIRHGWFGPEEIKVFEIISKAVRINRILEIGSWLGESTRWLASRFPEAEIICVDPWLPWKAASDPLLVAISARSFEIFQRNLWWHRDRLIPIRGRSQTALPYLEAVGYTPDLIYIDGDHSYEGAAHDLKTCRRIWPKAAIVGDDYTPAWPGVVTAVDEARAAGLRIENLGTTWFLIP